MRSQPQNHKPPPIPANASSFKSTWAATYEPQEAHPAPTTFYDSRQQFRPGPPLPRVGRQLSNSKTPYPERETTIVATIFKRLGRPAPVEKKNEQPDYAQTLLDWLMQRWPKNPISRRDISNHGPRPIRN